MKHFFVKYHITTIYDIYIKLLKYLNYYSTELVKILAFNKNTIFSLKTKSDFTLITRPISPRYINVLLSENAHRNKKN
ncbi:hypothetical protein BpHYR1_037682 [Brachionus plicatilis]|uniref:Uncharacterized protein n=1 Tax=Brachionus plicatilis TaxID=10195 RepID=A0A3M7QX12_BRAPC|nr:hypothetical protein BpHYR1_037682 [Brachionus plicatilis]